VAKREASHNAERAVVELDNAMRRVVDSTFARCFFPEPGSGRSSMTVLQTCR